MIARGARIEAFAVPGIPVVGRGADVPGLVWRALADAGTAVA